MNSTENRGSYSGISEADNKMAEQAIVSALGLGAFALLIVLSPILITGLIMGLLWCGARARDCEDDGNRLAWAVAISLLAVAYFFGFFPPFDRHFQGMLFTDFGRFTADEVGWVLASINSYLPKKFAIHSVSITQLRALGWGIPAIAGATFVYFKLKKVVRGDFVYRAFDFLFKPFRFIAGRWQWILALACISAGAAWFFQLHSWFRIGSLLSLTLLTTYHLVKFGFSGGEKAKEMTVGPLLVGREKSGQRRPARISDGQLNHHGHIVGASGFGKSVLLSHIIKNRIHSGSGLLFVDLKADFETIRQVVSTAHSAGRLDDLFIFSCGNPEISSPYNVLAHGTANQLKDRIMGALNWSEEFYKNEASSFLLKLLRGLTVVRDTVGKYFDLATVLSCADDTKQILGIINDLPESAHEVKDQLQTLVGYLSRSDNHGALKGLRSQLECLLLSDFGHLLRANSTGIDLFDAIREQKIVYVLLDSRTYGESAKALGKLILQDLKAASAKIDATVALRDRKPFTVIVDEFADMASEDFIGFLDRARSSKIGVVLAHQEIADLSRISPEFASRIMNSTSNLFAFNQKIPTSSELISGICGTRRTKEVTEQAKSNWLLGDEKTGMKSIKEVDEYIVHPNVIRSLEVGECVFVQKYPMSTSMVIRVNPEKKDYLEEAEVHKVLDKMKSRHVAIQPTVLTVVPPKPINPQETSESNYWNDEIEPKGDQIDV